MSNDPDILLLDEEPEPTPFDQLLASAASRYDLPLDVEDEEE